MIIHSGVSLPGGILQIVALLTKMVIFHSHVGLPWGTHPRVCERQPPLSGIGEVVAAFGDYKTCGFVDLGHNKMRDMGVC